MGKIPAQTITDLVAQMRQDPGLPNPIPTESFWQMPPAENSTAQSLNLPATTTYAVIGSGMTGCSVTKNLLDNFPSDSRATITLFEARALTSGATGRNGGHLVSPLAEEFHRMEKGLGLKEATRIARFANRTLDTMHSLAAKADPELQKAAEVRRTTIVTAYLNPKVLEAARSSYARYESQLPECKGDHTVYNSKETLEKFNVKSEGGSITSNAGALWPYRFVTGIFSRLQSQYKDRLRIEAKTPVTDVKHDPSHDTEHPYIITTPRGAVRATHVIYCTNGWSSHILPGMRGKIYSVRGTMSTQAVPPSFPREGHQRSWSTVLTPSYDSKTGTMNGGLYYITQNANTGDIFIGGEQSKIKEYFCSDDSGISVESKAALEKILPQIFDQGWGEQGGPEVRKVWSGIMGFTPDFLPWVGRLPSDVTGRAGNGEWIAAGFNGYGMPLCWGCGEAIAKMILGRSKEVEDWLPDSFLVTEKRWKSPFSTPEVGLSLMFEQLPSIGVMARLASSWLSSKGFELLKGSKEQAKDRAWTTASDLQVESLQKV